MPQRKNPKPKRVSDTQEDATAMDESLDQKLPEKEVRFPDDPEALKDIPKESLYREDETGSWAVSKSDQNKDGKYVCPKCEREYATSSGLRYHMRHVCEHICRFPFTCLVCGEKLSELEETLEHIAGKHLKTRPSTRRKGRQDRSYFTEEYVDVDVKVEEVDSEDFVPSGDESCDDDVDCDDDSRLGRNKTPPSTPKSYSKSNPSTKPFGTIEHPYHETLQWLFDFLYPHEKKYKITFPNFTPQFEKWVKDEEFDVSKFSKSPSYKVYIEEKGDCLYECSGLEPFCALKESLASVVDFNAGGPVQALSWCPVPINKYGSRQYLALSTNPGLHTAVECYHESGLIQIWDCGVLDVHSKNMETPKFLFGITCNEAPIWELKWCRVGGKISHNDVESTAAPRLGILAAACASGVVLILTIPDVTASGVHEGDIFTAVPEMVLVPGFAEKARREQDFGQCLSVDWSLIDGGEWVAGGYSTGVVVMWKVKDPASILLSEESGCKQLSSCRIFVAHHMAIQSLCWCPYDKDIIATCSQDRYIKIWNKNYTWTPNITSQAKISMPTEMYWPILWCGVLTSTEEVFAGPWYHGVLFHDVCNQFSAPTPVIPFKSASFSMSFSDWMNCVAAGDSTGCACVQVTSNWNRKLKLSKKHTPRVQIFGTKVSWSSEDAGKADKNKDKDEPFNGQEQDVTFSFHDTDFLNLKNIEKRPCCKNVRLQDNFGAIACDQPFVQAVKKIRWNPNFGSHSWIATGLQCGLVRLHHVGDMHSQLMDEIVEELKEKMAGDKS